MHSILKWKILKEANDPPKKNKLTAAFERVLRIEAYNWGKFRQRTELINRAGGLYKPVGTSVE